MEGVIVLMIPIVGILTSPLILWIIFHYVNKDKMETQKTIQAMIENGQQIPPEILANLNEINRKSPQEKKEKDLRWGAIFVALGIAVVMFGLFHYGLGGNSFIYPPEGGMVLVDGNWGEFWRTVGYSSVFFLIGLARLFLWKYAKYDTGSSDQ